MKISVIVPIYNCERYLPECLKSIVNQSYKNLEIILVDDGSTDESSRICDEYALVDKRIKVIRQENKGVSAARNKGLEYATGELISFIDSDDTLDEDMYELLVRLLLEKEADVVHCGYKHIVGTEIRLVHDTKCIEVQDKEQALQCLIGGRLFVGSLWNKLYRREILDGIIFREDLKINEDILYNFEVFQKANKSVFADYAKYNYIAHKDSSACFVTPNERKLKDACVVNRFIYTRVKNSNIFDLACERYLRSLSGYYRYCMNNNKSECSNIAEIMWDVYKETKKIGKNIKITVWLIHTCPKLYGLIYLLYDKVRKPNWEV